MAVSDVLKKFAPYFLLAIVPLGALSPLWLHAHAMAFDMADYFLPNRYFLSECLRNRIFPWWNPYSGLGVPFHADPQSGAFYPIAWIIALVFGYNFYSINIEYLLHVAIAGWGMYRLMHSFTKSVTASLCMALGYQLSGVFIGNAQHLTWIISATWLPWVILYWKKIFEGGNFKNAIALALCLMMMTTGGYPAFIIVLIYIFAISIFVFVFQSYRKNEMKKVTKVILLQVLFGIIYLIITSPYIVSFAQALTYFTRAVAIENNPYKVLPFSPAAMISFLFPSATLSHGDFFRSDASMLNSYFGLLPLIFLIALFITKQPRKVWFLFLSSCFFLLISFGNYFFLWKLLFNSVPLINRIRFPAAFRLFAIFGFLITAGLVMNDVTTYKRTARAALIMLFLILGVATFSFLDEHRLVLPHFFSIEGLQSFYAGSTITNNILAESFIQVLIALLLLIILFFRDKIAQLRFHALLIMVIAADMIFATRMNLPVTVSSKFYADSLNMKLNQEPKGFPISMEKNLSDVTHEGNGSYAPSYYNNNLFRKQLAFNSYNPFDLKNRDSLDRFAEKTELLHHPLFYISNHVESVTANSNFTGVKLQQGIVLLDSDWSESAEIDERDSLISKLSIQKFIPGKMILSTNTNESALLTVLQNYYPNWKATIDGKPVKILQSNICMMSIVLPAGEHAVIFDYDPLFIRLLLEVSVTTQFLLIALLLSRRSRRRLTSLFKKD